MADKAFLRGGRLAFGAASALSLGSSGLLFRDLADLSQWILPNTKRSDVFATHENRYALATAFIVGTIANTAICEAVRGVAPFRVWAVVNGAGVAMFYAGFVNPWLMMRPRNNIRDAKYVPAADSLRYLKGEETVVVTQIPGTDLPHRAYPDSQILRPHVAHIGTAKASSSGAAAQYVMTYCGLTHLGMAFEIPLRRNPSEPEMDLAPMTQLENNLVLRDNSTGLVVGQQINGMNETALLLLSARNKKKKKKKNDAAPEDDAAANNGITSYEDTKRRPCDPQVLRGYEIGKEIPTWRMTLGNFVRTYPQGEVFLNDYQLFKSWTTNPVKSAYDSIMDAVFASTVEYQATNDKPVFPTVRNIDPRLPPKEQVYGFNIGNDYVALTESFVRDAPAGVRNLTVGGIPVVASWDADAGSLGIWYAPSNDDNTNNTNNKNSNRKNWWNNEKKAATTTTMTVTRPVNVHGQIAGSTTTTTKDDVIPPLRRVPTVKSGAYWFVWANFFPQTRVNPES